MNITLVILAAGMASRYGAMKQTEGFGPRGETIMDYSIYDAIAAGFNKVVFIIRKDFAESFIAAQEEKLSGKIALDYVYQEMDAYLGNHSVPEGRTKPWGTGHAILCASEKVREPFAVINADDFYGKDAFVKAARFLKNDCNSETYAIIGYPLASTLSEFGTVSRGVCKVDDKNNLVAINERTSIARREGAIMYEEGGKLFPVEEESSVSMNFWCFHPSVFAHSKKLFAEFLLKQGSEIKSEFFIPIIADAFISQLGGSIMVIPTNASWFGVTYKEDAPVVKASLERLIKEGLYPRLLWGESVEKAGS